MKQQRRAHALKAKRKRAKQAQRWAQEQAHHARLEEEAVARHEFLELQHQRQEKYRDAERRAAVDRRKKAEIRRQEANRIREGAHSAPICTSIREPHKARTRPGEGMEETNSSIRRRAAYAEDPPSLLPPFKPRNLKVQATRNHSAQYVCAVNALAARSAPQPDSPPPIEEDTRSPTSHALLSH